jgi:hypothetical protein
MSFLTLAPVEGNRNDWRMKTPTLRGQATGEIVMPNIIVKVPENAFRNLQPLAAPSVRASTDT